MTEKQTGIVLKRHDEFKIYCAKRGTSMTKILNELVEGILHDVKRGKENDEVIVLTKEPNDIAQKKPVVSDNPFKTPTLSVEQGVPAKYANRKAVAMAGLDVDALLRRKDTRILIEDCPLCGVHMFFDGKCGGCGQSYEKLGV
jgi:hypothetical protein